MRFQLALAIIAIASPGCARDERAGASDERRVASPDGRDAPPAPGDGRSASRASAVFQPMGGSSIAGEARLTDVGNGVRIVVTVRGLEPAGDHFHGLNILAATDCEDVDEASPHFDPDGAPHGPFDARAGARHAGDLGNVRAYDGAGRYDRVDRLLALEGPRSVVGRAIVIRAQADDAWSRDGAAGEIVGCGVLEPVDGATGDSS